MTGGTTARYCRCGTRLARDNSDNRCGSCQVADRMGEARLGHESGNGAIVARQRSSPSVPASFALVTGQDLRAARESAGVGLGQLAAGSGGDQPTGTPTRRTAPVGSLPAPPESVMLADVLLP